MIARYYDASESVFLSKDPLPGESINPKTQNGYNYADQNPLTYHDPDGHSSARFRYALRKGLQGLLAPYIGWANAGNIAGRIIGALGTAYGLNKAAQSAYNKSLLTSKHKMFKNKSTKALIKAAKKQAFRVLARKVPAMAAGGFLATIPDMWNFGYNFAKGWKNYRRK